VYDVVEQNYAEPVNPDKAIYNGAIPGMLHVLDPHSNFFDLSLFPVEGRSAGNITVGMTVGRATTGDRHCALCRNPAYRAGIGPVNHRGRRWQAH